MKGACRLREGIFDRWYIFHPTRDDLAWSGSQWVPSSPEGLPTGSFQVCNFFTEQEARDYCREYALEPQ
jgi:hypothetical protein